MADTSEFIRCGKGYRNVTMVRRMGNLYSNAKLTDQQVAEIKQRYAVGDITQKQLSIEYGTDRSNISHIIRGRRWKSIGKAIVNDEKAGD